MKKINLLSNWFESSVRPEEFDYCHKKNLMIFDRVINLKGRPTFNDFFDVAAKFPEDVNVIANLDIYFDESIYLSKWITDNEVYCLTRWEDDRAGNIIRFKDRHYGHPGEWSQDAWVFIGGIKVDAPFGLGYRGCDNHLAYLFTEKGLKVSNPSEDIRAIHVHNIDTNASVERGEKVGYPNYLSVPITRL